MPASIGYSGYTIVHAYYHSPWIKLAMEKLLSAEPGEWLYKKDVMEYAGLLSDRTSTGRWNLFLNAAGMKNGVGIIQRNKVRGATMCRINPEKWDYAVKAYSRMTNADDRGKFRDWLMDTQRMGSDQAQIISASAETMGKVLSQDEMLNGDPVGIADLFCDRTGRDIKLQSISVYRRAAKYWQMFNKEAEA